MCGIRLQLAGDGEHPQRQVLVRHAVSKGAVKRRPEVHSDPQSGSFHSQFGPRATCCSTHIVCVRKLQQGLSVQCVACGTRSGGVYWLLGKGRCLTMHMFIVVITRERNNRRKKEERRKVVSCRIKNSVRIPVMSCAQQGRRARSPTMTFHRSNLVETTPNHLLH